ncbi:unnamed protein product [Oppiella nova]|uniref:alpha-L-fucosidase n=1 Tax=Oppiella nova TaxID=334625 RepID=A0A7R9LXQ5_9ACAR|nr:unnamed protein product [Oppiella nova]CAG2167992.1 unnamed protein product [Oppiella nova]
MIEHLYRDFAGNILIEEQGGDLATAVRKQGLVFGAYHSLMDWFNPLFINDSNNRWKTNDFVKEKSRPELEELINRYKPEVIWSDGEWDAPDTYWNSTHILAWLYNDSPVKDTVVVNDRWGKVLGLNMCCHHGGFYTCADRYTPSVLQPHKWESCMSFDKNSWGFRREAPLADYMSTEEVVHSFVQTISCGGNLLLNIGPTHDGRIPLLFEERLRQLGSWLGINGEAVYATKPWVNHRTHQNDSVSGDVWYTYKDNNVYPIALSWPKNNQLELGDIDFNTVDTVELLGTTGQLDVKEKGKGVVITFPPLTPPVKLDYAYALRIKTK